MTSSSGMNRLDPVEEVAINLERIGGTFTLANDSSLVAGFFKITAKFNDSPEIYGKGCDGSTARGVRTG
jgi:hypothetical protein